MEEIKLIEADIKKRVADISDVISFVPPEYRNSDSLSYFVDSYANSRVNNLKEAVLAYDTYEHRQKMEKAMALIVSYTESIAYSQLVMVDQLERLNKNIWRTEILF